MKDKPPRGTIYAKNGHYYARISYYVNDKRRTKDHATGIAVDDSTPRKAEKQKRAALKIMQDYLDNFVETTADHKADSKEQSVIETAQAWLAHTSKSKAPGTVASYTTSVRDITQYFTAHPVRTVDLTATQVESYLDWERQRRQPDYQGPNKVKSRYKDASGIESTVHHRYTALRSILQFAVREEIIGRNVASKRDTHIQIPTPQRQEFDILTKDEALDLIRHLASEPLWFQITVLLGLLLGLRRSEVIGIRLCDIDWQRKILTIRRTVTQQTLNGKNTIIEKPFTKNRRLKVLNLSQELCNSLHYYIKEQEEYSNLFGPSYQHNWNGYLMRYPDGKRVPPNTITQHFNSFLTKHSLKKLRYHDLRHSCASILFSNGVDLLTIQRILGHAQLTTTQTYLHPLADRQSEALNTMSDQILLPVAIEKEESQN